MTRCEFYNEVTNRVKERAADCINPDQIVTGRRKTDDKKSAMLLVLNQEGEILTPTFNLDALYEEYLTQCPADAIVDGIEQTIRDHVAFMEQTGNISLDHYEQIRHRLRVRLISLGYGNASESKIVRIKLPFFFAFFFAEFRANGRRAFAPIMKEHLKKWNKTPEQLLEQIKANLAYEEEIILTPLKDAREGKDLDQLRNFWKDIPGKEEIEDAGLLLLTTLYQFFGASLLISDAVMNRLAEIIGTSFYLIPSSVHEVLIIPAYRLYDIEVLSSFIRSINESQAMSEDVLSNKVLFYERETGQMINATDYDKVYGASAFATVTNEYIRAAMDHAILDKAE